MPQEDNGPVFVELNDNDQNSLPICGHVQTEEPPVKQQMLPIPDVNSSRITINYRGFSIDVSNGVDEASLKKALKVVKDEHLVENAEKMGRIFREEVKKIDSPFIEQVRGRGLLNAIVTKPVKGKTAWDICIRMMEKGLLAKPTHDHIIRFAPPLTINEEELRVAIGIIKETFDEMGQ